MCSHKEGQGRKRERGRGIEGSADSASSRPPTRRGDKASASGRAVANLRAEIGLDQLDGRKGNGEQHPVRTEIISRPPVAPLDTPPPQMANFTRRNRKRFAAVIFPSMVPSACRRRHICAGGAVSLKLPPISKTHTLLALPANPEAAQSHNPRSRVEAQQLDSRPPPPPFQPSLPPHSH